MKKLLTSLLAGSCVLFTAITACPAQDEAEQPNVFDIPKLLAVHQMANRAVASLFAQQSYGEAEQVLRKVIARLPHVADLHYNLACALARQGRPDEAVESLAKAVELGFRNPSHITSDPDLQSLKGAKGFQELLVNAAEPMGEQKSPWHYEVKPAPIVDGVGKVTEDNVTWVSNRGLFHALFQFDDKPPADRPIVKGSGTISKLLQSWYKEGSAAGNHGDLYENRDSDHANMDYAALPQLTRVEFGPAAKERNLHQGAQLSMLYNHITIGNSSTAITAGPTWRSQPRHILTQPRGALILYLQYRSNHLYFYPEHHDHDPGHNGPKGKGYGDLIPVNTPYMVISQGSSGTDKPFLNAFGAALAAFRPEVKQALAKNGMLMPALQMMFRRSNKNVTSPADYLTGAAHPSVFPVKQLDPEKLVRMAHHLTTDVLPPLATLEILEASEAVVGRDYFDVGPREQLCTTPCAIARIVKSSAYMQRIVVSASSSKDLLNKPLTYRWVVLRGDADRIQIKKLTESGSVVELLVPYHERRPVQPGSDLESNRVDIGAFVHNGTYYSPPAFVSFFYLDNEKRVYDAKHRIQVIDYTDPKMKDNYVDPLMDFPKDWRDEYHYDASGQLTGWTRIRGDERQEFTAEGRLIVEQKPGGAPVTREVRYVVDSSAEGPKKLIQQVVEE